MKSKIKQFFSEKKALAITLSAVMAAVLVALIVFPILFATGVLGGAGEDGPEVGVYYFDAEFDEYTLSLNSKNTFTIAVKGKTETGKYTLAGEKLTLDFDTADKDNLIANLSGNVITIQYDGAYMRMLKKVNYTVSFATNGGSAVSALTVVNGKLVKAPANPTRDNYDFVGWYADGEFKTVFDFAAPITADTTLYAKWEEKSSGPVAEASVTVTDSRIGWTTVSGVRSYQVEIIAPDGSVVHKHNTSANVYEFSFEELSAAVYTVKVTAYANTGSADNVVMEAIYKHHALGKVDGFKVENGMLIYNTVENAQKYYVTVVCGNANHNHTEFDNGSNRFFNLTNCDMTADGIKVTVKAVAEGFASSISDEFVYKKELAAVEGLRFDEATQSVFWNAVENAEAYMVSVTCGDASHSHVFFNNGTSNFVSLNGCAPLEGGIVVKVYPVTDGYASPEASEFKYEMTKLQAPAGVTVNGTLVSWPETKDAEKYEIKVNGNTYETETNSYDMAALLSYVEGAEYEIIVRALSSDNESAWSTPVKALYNKMSTLVYNKGEVVWAPVVGATGFEVQVNDGDVAAVPAGAASAAVVLDRAGVNTVKVRFVDGSVRSEWSVVTVYAHAITFDTQGGSQIFVQYKAVGDKIDYPTATKPGYTFLDWYTVPGGAASNGKLFDDELFTGSGAMVLYAGYKANEYEIVYDYGNGGVGTDLVGKVPYNGHYTLEVPVANDATTTFGGWFSAPYGMGVQYTDQYGNSLAPWTTLGGGKMYAFWVDLSLSFTQTKYNGKDVYMVSAGNRINLVTEITIPEVYNGLPVAIIAGNAFADCTNLETINIPATIEQIAQPSPFTGCTALKNVNVYDVEGVSARFWSADGVLFDNGTAAVASPKLYFMPAAKTGTYVIPQGITEIPENAFANSLISKVIVPASVTLIGREAFANAENLVNVTFETAQNEQPLMIGARAFLNCTALEKINLPARLQEIKLSKYTLSGDDVDVDTVEDAFLGCESLETITIAKGNKSYKAVDNIIYSADGRTLLYVPVNFYEEDYAFEIPAGTQAVAPGAFIGVEDIEVLTLPNTMTLVGECAFYDNGDIETLIFEGGALSELTIGKFAFRGCYYITEITLTGARLAVIGEGAFWGCEYLESFTIPATVTEIKANAFRDCFDLETVSFESNGRPLVFGENVFYNCSSLARVDLPANVSELPGVFTGCSSLTEVTVADDNPYFTSEEGVLFNKAKTELLFFPQGKTGDYTIPATVTKIANGVFSGIDGLDTLTIPNSITTIGQDAFKGSAIDEIVFTGEASEGITIGASAFEEAEFGILTLPAHTKSIGERAFANSYFDTVILNEGLTELPAYLFFNASSYEAVVVPASVESIGEYCFAGDSDSWWAYAVDVEFTLENSKLKYIGRNAFAANEEITSITLPESLEVIDHYAFYEATSLETVTFDGDNPQLKSIGGYAFSASSSYYGVPITEIVIPKNVTTIYAGAFKNCGDLEKVTFENGGTTDPLVIGAAFMATVSSWSGTYTELREGEVFYQTSYLEEVYLPERLSVLGAYTFYYAGGYTTLTVDFGANSNLTTIGAYCFHYAGLESITIPKSVRNLDPVINDEFGRSYDRLGIGEHAFDFLYDSLATVTFEAGGTGALTIGKNAFDTCRLLASIELPARIAPYTSYTGEVIPGVSAEVFNEATGLKSISVAGEGDYYASLGGVLYTADMKELIFCPVALEGTVTVPATVTKIRDRAFYGCNAVEAIEFVGGEENMTIGNEAFCKCSKLTALVLPDNVTTIGADAFYGCTELMTLTLPKRLASFSPSVFDNCPKLSSISISSDGQGDNYSSIDGVIFNADATTLIFYPATKADTVYTVPATVKTIAAGAFMNNTVLTRVILPDGLVEIGDDAFNVCSALESINIPSSVEFIGNNALRNCSKLSSVAFDMTGSKQLFMGNSVFESDSALASIALPARLAVMGNRVFANTALAEVLFDAESKLSSMGDEVFYGTDLINVTLPEGIAYIGSATFYDCNSLLSVTFGEGLVTLGEKTFTSCDTIMEVHFPASLRNLGAYTFSNPSYVNSGCTTLKIVTFGENSQLQSIPEGTFAYTGIESILIPASVKVIADKDVNVSYGGGAFEGCSLLTNVAFEDGSACTKLGYNAFYNCTALEQFTIPASVYSIGDSAFEGCSALLSIEIPVSVTEFGAEAFRSCSSLKTAVIKAKATTLSSYMFAYCYDLTSVVIPEGVTKLDNACFDSTGLVEVVLPASVVDLSAWSIFSGCEDLERVTILGNVKVLGESMFEDCVSLVEVNLPASLEEIGESVFAWCESLTEFEIPASLKSFSLDAFSYSGLAAYSLEGESTKYKVVDGVLFSADGTELISYPAGKAGASYEIPAGVTVIKEGAFYGVVALESVTLNDGLVEIESGAFYECENLGGNVFIPASVVKAGDYIFFDCGDIIFLVEAAERPEGWGEEWNYSYYYSGYDCPVLWGFSGEDITYTFVGGEGASAVDNIVSAEPITLPAGPTRSGFVFLGWYDNENCEGEAITGSYYNSVKTTLYAKWMSQAEYEEAFRGQTKELPIEIISGETYTVVIDTAKQQIYFVITTTESAEIWNIKSSGDGDHMFFFYDEEGNFLDEYDSGVAENIDWKFDDPGTYIIGVGYYKNYSTTGDFQVTFTKR